MDQKQLLSAIKDLDLLTLVELYMEAKTGDSSFTVDSLPAQTAIEIYSLVEAINDHLTSDPDTDI
jgi:hypothetical protein